MIHFAPLQKRGASDSPYSIYDQMSFSDEIFGSEGQSLTDAVKQAQIQKFVISMEKDLGMLSATDVVCFGLFGTYG